MWIKKDTWKRATDALTESGWHWGFDGDKGKLFRDLSSDVQLKRRVEQYEDLAKAQARNETLRDVMKAFGLDSCYESKYTDNGYLTAVEQFTADIRTLLAGARAESSLKAYKKARKRLIKALERGTHD